jgi:hypothetical protein
MSLVTGYDVGALSFDVGATSEGVMAFGVPRLTSYCYGVVWYKASHALPPFSDLLCSPSEL